MNILIKKNILLVIAICTFTIGICQPNDAKKTMIAKQEMEKLEAKLLNQKGTDLPIFNILQYDSTAYNTKDIDKYKSAVLVLFNPGCEHCMEFAKMVMANENKFPNTQFVLVAGDKTFQYMNGFIDKIKYKKDAQIIIGIDLDYISAKIFAYEGIPQIMVYGTDKKLIDVLYKEATPEKLLLLLNDKKNKFEISKDSPPQIIENTKKRKKKLRF